MVNVKRRIDRNFKTYAVSLYFKNENQYLCSDGETFQVWFRKKRALELAHKIILTFEQGSK